jgi:hypothetical protein
MKHKPSTTAKWNNGFKKIHNLKVERTDDSILFSKLSDIYSHFEILFDIYNNDKLTDKERAIISEVKKEKVAERVRKSYKKKLNKVQRQLDNTISPKERRKVGYLKYKARQRLNRPPSTISAVSMVKFSKVDIQE